MFTRLLVFCMLALLFGCSSSRSGDGYSVRDEFRNPHDKNLYTALQRSIKESRYDEQASNAKLVEVSAAVSNSLRELAKIQRSIHDVRQFKADPSLSRLVVPGQTSVDWTGPAHTFLEKIARSSGLKFRSVGNPPPVPIIVSVNKRDIRINDLIVDVAYQIQNQATVAITKGKVVELRYR